MGKRNTLIKKRKFQKGYYFPNMVHVNEQGYAPLRLLRKELNLDDDYLSNKYGVSKWFVQELRRKQNANPWPSPTA